jgi:DNA-binding transcriptional LysR family regulator
LKSISTIGWSISLPLSHRGRSVELHLHGQFIGNTTAQMLDAALAGVGIAYVPFAMAHQYLEKRLLVPVLEDWWAVFPGSLLSEPTLHLSSVRACSGSASFPRESAGTATVE